MTITNAISIDVEDYFQVSAFENTIDRCKWDNLEHRVAGNIDRVLSVFSDYDVKATFFTLGWVAERYPNIVKKICENGHELASHGYGHQRVSNLSPKEFSDDLLRAKHILQDISGREIKGYRAPSYSIGEKNIWALQVLAETGHKYSSSIYPIKHDHYGYPLAPRFVFKDEKSGLIEIPVTTMKLFGRTFPAGGGGFFRFYPYFLSKMIIRRVNKMDDEPSVFYLHPWELDPDQPVQKGINLKTKFRHYLNLDRTEGRLKRLLQDFQWDTVENVFINDRNVKSYSLW